MKKCKGCGCYFADDRGIYCDDCLASEEHLNPWDYVTGEVE